MLTTLQYKLLYNVSRSGNCRQAARTVIDVFIAKLDEFQFLSIF